jgi:phospholipid/cholesterol/gamma-HCH transport system ATP-binding protein
MASEAIVLTFDDVAIAERRAGTNLLKLGVGRGETALIEVGEDGDTELLIDLCLGLLLPLGGEVRFRDVAWRSRSYREMLALRSRIGTLVGSQAWPAHVPVAEVVMTPALYHSNRDLDDAVEGATTLARNFGLPGLPTGTREGMRPGELLRAACVRAFFGAPELVLISDETLETAGELATPLAQAICAVQDRGGAVLWLLESGSAPAARFVAARHNLRLGDRGLVPLRRRT